MKQEKHIDVAAEHSGRRFFNFLCFTFQIFWSVVLVIASYILNRPLSGHALIIKHISLRHLTLYGVRYCGALYDHEYTYTFTAETISCAFHVPRPSYSHWLTINAKSIFYASTTCDLSIATLDVTAWVFPYLFKRTVGPWTSVVLDGFCVRVHKSSATPYWISRLRQNIVCAILTGDIYRLDDMSVSVQFAGLSEPLAPGRAKTRRRRGPDPVTVSIPGPDQRGCDGYDMSNSGSESGYGSSADVEEGDDESDALYSGPRGEVVDDNPDSYANKDALEERMFKEDADRELPIHHPDIAPPFENKDVDELRITGYARQLHLSNRQGRVYTFESVDAQLRRDWDTDRGSFVTVAEDGRWVRVPWPYQMEMTSWWTQLFTSVIQLPLDLWHVLTFPMSTVDLHILRTDITFDQFKIRDADLIFQSLVMLREKTARLGINWGDVLLDAMVQAFVRP